MSAHLLRRSVCYSVHEPVELIAHVLGCNTSGGTLEVLFAANVK